MRKDMPYINSEMEAAYTTIGSFLCCFLIIIFFPFFFFFAVS